MLFPFGSLQYFQEKNNNPRNMKLKVNIHKSAFGLRDKFPTSLNK